MSEKSLKAAEIAVDLAAIVFTIESVYDIPPDVMDRIVALRDKLVADIGEAHMSAEDLFNYLFDKYGV